MQVTAIPAFSDNYIWCIHSDTSAIVVDPGQSKPVLQFLQEHKIDLIAVIVTHHHYDHTGGLLDLLAKYPQSVVYGPQLSQIDGVTHPLVGDECLKLALKPLECRVLAIPGHTLDHIGFYFEKQQWLFCGDTLFSGGCGRLFEGTPRQMFNSLQQINSLPDECQVFCAHEYTESNLQFACEFSPDNTKLQHHLSRVKQLRQSSKSTIPTTLAVERQCNLFLMAKTEEDFTVVRRAKDNW